jgi:hypothetical protein
MRPVSDYTFFLKKKGIYCSDNINHTCKLQNCSLINQFTTVSLQLHVGESDLLLYNTQKTLQILYPHYH